MQKQKLPNATTVLILGIASIITCCCYGVVGLAAGGIGLMLSGKDKKLYNENPDQYSNYNNLKIGRVLCIIGIILSALWLIYMIFIFTLVGFEGMQNPELMQEKLRELLGQ